ncbi:MAG: hypothetical protein H6736_14810 [Alphaproteobacteria bacterium]|nr:hypothetical protein [Alphaproteobacteria bacterium]
MVGLLLIAGLAHAGDCSLGSQLQRAETAILSLDLDGGQAALDEAKERFACGATPNEDLARYWLLVAAHAEFSGRSERVEDALVAARASNPSVYLNALGPDLEARWKVAKSREGSATVLLVDLPEGYEVRVDGNIADPGSIRPGFHVVQAAGGDHGWGRVVRASSGDSIQLSTDLPALPKVVAVAPTPVPDPVQPPEPEEPRPPREPREAGLVGLHAALGLSSAFGEGYGNEPATKLGPQVEVGLVLRPADAVWLRAAVMGDVLLGGAWSYFGAGEVKTLPLGIGLLAGGGITLGENLDVGALTGMQLPGRIPVRALGRYHVNDLLGVELRAGVNLGTPDDSGMRLEPAASLHATLTL